MCAHRDFLYKRSPHDALAARVNPLQLVSSVGTPTSASSPGVSDAKHTTIDPPIVSLTSDTPTPSPSSAQATTPSSTPDDSHTSSSSSSASKSSSLPSSSSAISATLSSAPTPVAVTTSSAVHANSPSTQVIINSLTHTPSMSTPSPSTTSSPTSGGVKTGAVIGGVAGTLAAIAALGLLLMWCMRRQRNRDVDDFDAQAFKRQSVVLLDDHVEPRTFNPRPPTMIEHHNASPALAAQGGFSGQNFYGNYGEYTQQPSYAPPEMMQPVGSPAPQAYPAAPMGYPARQSSAMGRPVYDPTQQLPRQPSNAQYLTRQPTSAPGYAPPAPPPASVDPHTRYIDLNRSSVSPYQAAQYADISRQLGTNNPNAHLPHESLDLPDDPLPSPFDSPADGSVAPTHAPAPAAAVPSVQAHGNVTQPHQRPETVYEEVDAYGGI